MPGFRFCGNAGFFYIFSKKEFAAPRCGAIRLYSPLTRRKKEFRMKQVKNLFVIAAVALAIIVSMAGCSSPTSPTPTPGGKDDTDKTPAVGDYDISKNLEQNVGKVTPITVTAKADKSGGAVTVYYEGMEGTTYAKSTTLPTVVGIYAVTFDVAAAEGWKAKSGLSAGTLTISDPSLKTPAVGDYDISGNQTQTVGSVTAVTVTAKSGKSGGKVTVYYAGTGSTTYEKSTTLPTEAGTYAVTFDVATADGWNPASGLSAGTLTINPAGTDSTPDVNDYTIGNLSQTFGNVTAVTVTAKSGKSGGAVTVYYEGISGTTYAKSTDLPTAIGIYAVTFDVAAATGWKAASDLSAGTLTITDPSRSTPGAGDYDIGNLTQTVGSVTAVTVTAKSGKSGGDITVYYEGIDGTDYEKSTDLPTAAGIYAVTFDVATADGWNPATGLSAGTLTISDPSLQTPVVGDYDISSNLTQTFGSVTAVTVTPKSGKSDGAVTVYYEGISGTSYPKSATLPTNAGTYTVTFDVAAVEGTYNAKTGLSAGTLTINKAEPTVTTWPTAAAITYGAALSTSALTGGVSTPEGTFAWEAPATIPTVTNTGYSVTFTPTDTGNYNTATHTVSITVAKADPTVTTWPTAAGITYGAALSTSALSGGVNTTPGSFAWTTPATVPTVTNSGYSVTFTPTDTSNYNTATHTVSITVAKANPTVTTWPTAAGITYGAALSTSALSGGASTPAGTFTWTTPATVPNSVGTSEYSVTFTPTDTANYNTAAHTVSITVNATYTITQIGGAAGATTTTGISFTFNASIDSLGISVGDITVGGTTVKGPTATFTGSGTSWTLSPVTVSSTGDATVSINKTGIESGNKTVPVYYVTGTATISVTFANITDAASGITIVIPDLHRVTGTSTAVLTLTNPGQYDANSITWEVNGTEIGTDSSVTLNAANPVSVYRAFGTHYLTINVKKDGVPYSKTVSFTVAY